MQVNNSQLTLKHVRPINFLFFQTRTRVCDLGRFVGIISRELHRDAALNDLEVTGPVYWEYDGFDRGDELKEFTLDIGLPVAELPNEYVGKFRLKRTEPSTCLSMIHYGSWYHLGSSYDHLFQCISENNLTPDNSRREIYINIDIADPRGNVTEIQVGVMNDRIEVGQGLNSSRVIHAVEI